MKNKLIDLNNHLFAQLERLSEENISDDALEREIYRTRAITAVAKEIIGNGALALEASKALANGAIKSPPQMVEGPAE